MKPLLLTARYDLLNVGCFLLSISWIDFLFCLTELFSYELIVFFEARLVIIITAIMIIIINY